MKSIKLTPDILNKLGFRAEGKSILNKPLYRLEYDKNLYHIQIELGNYPDSNPNSGIVSIYYPELKDQHIPAYDLKENMETTLKVDHITHHDENFVYAIKYMTFGEKCFPIAWNVTTLERLNKIYTALTNRPALRLK